MTGPIEVVAGGFTGKIAVSLGVNELLSFRADWRRLTRSSARLDSMEEWLSLTVWVERSGRVEIDGEAKDQPSSDNRLSFHSTDLDQTGLPALIDALEKAFPVLGQR
ncbi:hypothetical protein FNH05_04875 [Amycolatopsis rhizosphaerae]|uniref:Uncharacterized protein n=1 Tax=Amycolatopsis rhizosphaerae TaxID=2053003 RepID=A0A558DGF6_9PSEU|nr:hypothetical protein [Amycolatopsis rhizosphaerae]TVT60115.1 hypothetical protein FNH05_04875 [Amycolatopsis rhizosphaerae]